MVHIKAHSASTKNNPSLLDLCYLNVLKLTTPLLTLLNLFKLEYWGNDIKPIHTLRPVTELIRATPSSAGLDLCSTVTTILTPDSTAVKVPTGVHGPLPRETMGLLIGRSPTSLHGITVIPEVIDSDYTGEIQIMVSPPTKTIQIYKGQKIAQLLMLPCHADTRKAASAAKCWDRGSDSSDHAFWVTQVTQKRPMKTILVNGKKVTGLLDTGADISCIAGSDWPSAWPTQTTANELVGIGRAPSVTKSSQILLWYVDKDCQGHFQPYVIPSLGEIFLLRWEFCCIAQMKRWLHRCRR